MGAARVRRPTAWALAEPGRTLAPFGRRLAPVIANRAAGSYRVFAVEDPAGPQPRAGQFYMLATAWRWDSDGERPYLPRAFSVALADQGRLEFLVADIGPGTERLAAVEEGEELWLTGPLGRPFSDPASLAGAGSSAVLVGGGVGVAPLAIWQRRLSADGIEVPALLGFRDAGHAGGWDLFEGEVRLASDDGHLGHSGRVTELLEQELADAHPLPSPAERSREAGVVRSVAVYACGPPAMLESVRALCGERGIACELAMESGMACGFGACFGCVVPTSSGYIRLCVDGPVVNAAELESALVPGVGH